MILEGIYAPIPTAFDSDGLELNLGAFRENLRKWGRSPLDGVVVCGSNGELPFLTPDERAVLTETVKSVFDEQGSRQKIITCTYLHSTKETIACSKAVADAGADAVLVLPPHYFKASGMEGAKRFFIAVADASPLPVVLYNMPANTGVDLDVETVTELAGHPNIIGVKDTSGNATKLVYLAAAQNDSFSLFSGSGNYFLPALSVGARGGTLAVANIYPGACRELVKRYAAGDNGGAKELQHRILLASDAVTGKFGIPGLKAAMDHLGMYGGRCRSPLAPLSEEKKKKLLELLEKAALESFEEWR